MKVLKQLEGDYTQKKPRKVYSETNLAVISVGVHMLKSFENNDYLEKVLNLFNTYRANEKFRDDEIEDLNREFGFIRGKIEGLMEDNIPLDEKEIQLKKYLNNVAEGGNKRVQSPALIRLVKLVNDDLEKEKSKFKPKK